MTRLHSMHNKAAIASVALGLVCGLAPVTTWARARDTVAETQPAEAKKTDHFLRVVDQKNKSVELQIASRDYAPVAGATGPRVGLIAVAHIGDRNFYRELQKLLATYDVVLYESVKPDGTSKPDGETAEERIESTKAAMRFVGGLIESYRKQHENYPANLDAVKDFAAEHDPRLAQFLAAAIVDAWGTPLRYEWKNAKPTFPVGEGRGEGAPHGDKPEGATPKPQDSYTLLSLGADHSLGGENENADIDLGDEVPPDPLELSKDDGLQSQLADALGLEFQLDALDYSPANWRCSDMAMDEINRRLEAKGLDFEMLGGTLAGSSLPAKLIKALLGVMKFFDSFMEGAIADTFKVAMIELLGDPTLVDGALNQMGAGFGEVIIDDRNQIPINDLKAIIEGEPEVKSVAILYGAGHMSGLHQDLCKLNYAPIPGEEGEHWHTAIKVDLTKSAITPREMNQIRVMIRQTIKQQMGAK